MIRQHSRFRVPLIGAVLATAMLGAVAALALPAASAAATVATGDTVRSCAASYQMAGAQSAVSVSDTKYNAGDFWERSFAKVNNANHRGACVHRSQFRSAGGTVVLNTQATADSGVATGQANFGGEFTITEPTTMTLTDVIVGIDAPAADLSVARLLLSGPGSSLVFDYQATVVDQDLNIASVDYVLQPGSYNLQSWVVAHGDQGAYAGDNQSSVRADFAFTAAAAEDAVVVGASARGCSAGFSTGGEPTTRLETTNETNGLWEQVFFQANPADENQVGSCGHRSNFTAAGGDVALNVAAFGSAGGATGNSVFSGTFTVTRPTTMTFTDVTIRTDQNRGAVNAQLVLINNDTGRTIFDYGAPTGDRLDLSYPFHALDLEPGTYSLAAVASASSDQAAAVGNQISTVQAKFSFD